MSMIDRSWLRMRAFCAAMALASRISRSGSGSRAIQCAAESSAWVTPTTPVGAGGTGVRAARLAGNSAASSRTAGGHRRWPRLPGPGRRDEDAMGFFIAAVLPRGSREE